jgi:hypothetical protein
MFSHGNFREIMATNYDSNLSGLARAARLLMKDFGTNDPYTLGEDCSSVDVEQLSQTVSKKSVGHILSTSFHGKYKVGVMENGGKTCRVWKFDKAHIERLAKSYQIVRRESNEDRPQPLYIVSAYACSEIGLKWFLFAFHDLRKALASYTSLISLSNSLLEHWQKYENGIMAIFDHFRNTHTRASSLEALRPLKSFSLVDKLRLFPEKKD